MDSRSIRSPVLIGAIVALISRLTLIAIVPGNYSFDAYQRWAGREQLLVRDWLPATQLAVWVTAKLGGGIVEMRVVMALIAAAATAAGVRVCQRIGGEAAGWSFVPLALLSPFVTWSTVPYQEGTFLALLLGALAAALSGRMMLADLLAGGLALVRYEGWPVVALYILWRRDRQALRALWGPALWVGMGLAGLEGHAPSPISYADWEGITARFSWGTLAESLGKLARHAGRSGTWAVLLVGVAGLAEALRRRRPGAGLLGLIALTQLAVLVPWMVGLETAISRMQVVVGVLAAVLAACFAGWRWQAWGRAGRALIAAALISAGIAWSVIAIQQAQRSSRSVRWEQALVAEMDRCGDCSWSVSPREGLGTRARHDGCEIIQGISERLHGRDFRCETWTEDAALGVEEGQWRAVWQRGGYRILPPARDSSSTPIQ